MGNRIFVSVADGCEKPKFFDDVEPFVNQLMEKLKYDGEEVSIVFCSDDFIQNLNKQYRQIDAPTDVLSFENGETYEDDEGEWRAMGDIVISLETLPKNAKYFNVTEDVELKRLLLHGLLHLNGYDHGEEHIEKDALPKCKMLRLQEKILREI